MKAPWSKWLERKEHRAVEIARESITQEARAEFARDVARRMQSSQVPSTGPVAGYPGAQASPYPLYALDQPISYATPNSPRRRPDSAVDITTIRRFADTYDPLRSCINHLKREVQAQKFCIVSRDGDSSDAAKKRIALAEQFFTKSGGLGEKNETRRHYEQKIFEDVLVVGAFAVWKSLTLSGALIQALPIDAATIRPRLDPYGWPGPGEDWYEQWILGMKVTGFSPEEIAYDGLWPMTHTPWFRSPVEYLIFTVLTALKSDEWNRSWLTDGNTPGQTISTPPEWTPEQIAQYDLYFNAMLTGDTRARQKTVFIPGGAHPSQQLSRKDQDFQEFDLWLLRRTCAIYGVQPSSIGFAGEQYKVSQEGSNDQTTQFGAGDLLDLRKEHYDDLLLDLGFDDLEVLNGEAAEEDPLKRAQRLTLAMGGKAWIGANDARQEEGRDLVDGGDFEPAKETVPVEPAEDEPDADKEELDLDRWMRKCIKRVKEGRKAQCPFASRFIPAPTVDRIMARLATCESVDDVRQAFA